MRRLIYILMLSLLPLSAAANDISYGGKPFVRNFSALDYHGHNRNFDVECDTTGKVYVANFEGVLVWDGEQWKMTHTPGISRITSLFKTPSGRIWFGGYNVIGTISDKDEFIYVARESDNRENFGEVESIFLSERRLMFVAGGNQYFVNGSIVEKCSTVDADWRPSSTWRGVTVNQTVALEDLGLVAKATSSLGVVILDGQGNLVYSLSKEDGLCSNAVSALAYDGKGSLWGATDNGLFQIILSPVYSHYGLSDGLEGQVTSILKTNDGQLLVGTMQGLFVLNDKDRFDKVEGLDLACWHLAQTPDGSILAATAQGTFKYDEELEWISHRHTLTLFVEGDKSFITGEIDGIYRYHIDKREEKLNDIPNVAKFARAADGSVRAINYYRETYLMKPGEHDFSPCDDPDLSLTFDYTDSSGRHWHSNADNKGILCDVLSERELSWCRPLDAYTVEAMDVENDVAYVGGVFGLVRIDIRQLLSNEPYAPSVYLRSFMVDNFTVDFYASQGKTDPIGQAEYSYRFNDDEPWTSWSTDPEGYVGTQNIGKYYLTVRCRDAYGNIAVSEPYYFEIEAPFFFKWYAILFYMAVIGIVSYFFRVQAVKKVLKDQERLEKLVNERTQELRDAQKELVRKEREATVGKLTKGLIDRILNPMNYINNFSHLSIGLTKDIGEDLEDDKDNISEDIYDDCSDVLGMLKSNLEKIEQHGLATTRILKAMEELLKDHTGKVEECDILQICTKDVEMLHNYYKNDIEELGMEIKTEFPSSPVFVQANQINISKVIMSMASNSVYALRKKFSKVQSSASEKPVICISLARQESGSGCRISVYDNGIGIEESILDKIFDPFFTTKPTGEAPGVGLYLSQQVIMDLGGDIKVESKKDEFTRFTIELQ